jgi:hypothetical protein
MTRLHDLCFSLVAGVHTCNRNCCHRYTNTKRRTGCNTEAIPRCGHRHARWPSHEASYMRSLAQYDPKVEIENITLIATSERSDPEVETHKGYKDVSVDRNSVTETQTLTSGREGRKSCRKPEGSDQQQRKPTETQGPCPDPKGFCIKVPYRDRTTRST